MACLIENTTNKELQSLIDTYGQAEGLRLFLNPKPSYESKILDQQPVDNYTKIQLQLTNRRINLLNNLNKEKDKLKIEFLNEKIQDVNNQLELLDKEKTIENIKSIFDSQYKWLVEMLNEETPTLSDLNLIKQFIGGWKGMKEMFLSEDLYDNPELESVQQINSIENKIQSLSIKWNNKVGKAIFNEVKDKSKRTIQDNDYERVIKVIEDVGVLESNIYDASALNNVVLQIMNKVTTDSNKSTEKSYNDIINNLKIIYEKISKKGIKDFNWLLQKNNEGELTGSFVDRFSFIYFEKTKELKNKVNTSFKNFKKNNSAVNSNKLKQALKERGNWYKDNTISIDFRYLDIIDYQGITEQNKIEYKNNIIKQYGLERSEELFDKANDLYTTYLTAKQRYQDYQDTQLSLQSITDQEYTDNIDNWDLENNPVYYIQQIEGNDTDASIKHIKNKGYKYIITQPKMLDNNNNLTDWYDKDYIDLQKDKDKLEYYNFAKSTIQDLTSYLPSYVTDDLHKGFIPVIKEELNESFTKNGIKGFLKSYSEEFINKYLVAESDNKYSLTDPNTGEVIKTPKVGFINSDISIDERSFDLNSILQSYGMMALNYKNKTDIEDFINLSIDVFKTAQIDKDLKQNPQNLIKVAEYLRDHHIYNERYKEQFVDKSKKRYKSKEDREKAEALYKQMSNIETLIENETNEEKKIKLVKEYKKVSSDYKKLGGFVSYSRIIQEAMYMQTLKAFAFNPFSAFANLSFGLMSNLTFASGGEYVNNNNIVKSFGIMLNSTRKIVGNGNITASKVAFLMDKLQIEAKVGDLDGLSNTVKKDFWKDLVHKYPFALMKSSDYFMRGQLLVGMLLNKKVTDLSGNQRDMWEAFDSSGLWIEDKFGPEPDLTDFRNIAQQIQKRVHGNQDKQNSPILLNKGVLGRMIGQFRSSWVFEGFRSRFQDEIFDEQLGDYTKGRYKTLGEQGIKGVGSFLFIDQFKYLINKGLYNNLSQIDKANMKRNLTELYLMESMLLIGLLLKGLYDDDEDKDSAYKITKNLLNRSMDDVLFYINPTSFENIVKNPVPMFKVVTDVTNAGKATFKYMTDEDYESDKLIRKYTNILPATNIYNKITTWSEREF